MAGGLTHFPIRLHASPPSLLRVGLPPADDSSSTLINPTFLVEIEQTKAAIQFGAHRGRVLSPSLAPSTPHCLVSQHVLVWLWLTGWIEKMANTLDLA